MEGRLGRGDPQPQSDILTRFEAAVGAIQDSDSFRRWLERSGSTLGRRYVSELERNFRGYAPV